MTSPLFTQEEARALRQRELPAAPFQPSLHDLDGGVIFGGGILARQVLTRMREAGLTPGWIVDSNPALWDTLLDGIPVRSPASLEAAEDQVVVVASTHLSAMAKRCIEARVARWSWFYDLSEVFGPIHVGASAASVIDTPEPRRLHALLVHSPASQAVLKRALAFRVTGDPADLPPSLPDQYFAPDLVDPRHLRCFVDCGAYSGDTLLEWVERFAGRSAADAPLAYHAFEPDPVNHEALATTASRLPNGLTNRCRLHRCGVGAAEATLRLSTGGSGSVLTRMPGTGPEVRVVRLDDRLTNEPVTAIKMDIEGFEPHALEGARALVQRRRPALMIAVYHRPEHLWQIPLWIHDVDPTYRLHLRHHSPSFAETVCYAIPGQS